MINNNTYQTLPFYDSVEKQNFKQEWLYNDLCSTYLICPQNRLIPFQLTRRTKYNAVYFVQLWCFKGTFEESIMGDIPAGDLVITTVGSTDYITYFGNKDLTDDLPCGLFYLMISDGVQLWYSEVFKVVELDYNSIIKSVINPKNYTDEGIAINSSDVLVFKSN